MPEKAERLCGRGIHRLDKPGAMTGNRCRVCWNEYQNGYRRQSTKARRQLDAILTMLEDQNQTAEV